jgi:hypothetical protein
MKGQSHLTISQDPHNWQLAPPVMYGLCGAEVQNPTPVDTFTAEHGRVPEFNPLSTCAKCIEHRADEIGLHRRRRIGRPDAGAFYIYAIADKREIEKREHKGDTIQQLEKTVERIGVESSLPKS